MDTTAQLENQTRVILGILLNHWPRSFETDMILIINIYKQNISNETEEEENKWLVIQTLTIQNATCQFEIIFYMITKYREFMQLYQQ
jgi:hypothetical protein